MKRMNFYSKVLLIVIVLVFGIGVSNVYAKPAKALTFQKNKITMYTSQKENLRVKKSNKYRKSKVIYKSSNPEVVKVSKKGKITALSKGKAQVTATIKGTKKKAKVKITVLQKVESITLQQQPEKYYVGKQYQLHAVTFPAITDEKIKWKSSDRKIAKINKTGLLTVKHPGNVTITVYSSKTKEETSINIITEYVPQIKFQEGTKKIIQSGEGFQLHIEYINHKLEQFTYTISDNTIATVSQSGYVQSIRPGDVYITATTKDKKEKITIKVIIGKKNGFLSKLMLDNMGLDDCTKLMIVAHPDDESLWGGGHLQEGKWLVVCLTNYSFLVRQNEFKSSMKMLGQKGIILDYPDLQKTKEGKNTKNLWGDVKEGMAKDLRLLVNYKNWEQIVTHNPDGEYGHIHHKKVNNAVTTVCNENKNINKLWYFGKFYEKGKIPVDLTKIPDELFKKKDDVLKNCYKRESWSIPYYWGHMNPYENWVQASAWK